MWWLLAWYRSWQLNRTRNGRRAPLTRLQILTRLLTDIQLSHVGTYTRNLDDSNSAQAVLSRLDGQSFTMPAIPNGRFYNTPAIQQQLTELDSLLSSIKDLCDRGIMSLDDQLDRRMNQYFNLYAPTR